MSDSTPTASAQDQDVQVANTSTSETSMQSQARAQPRPAAGFAMFKTILLRMFIIYMISSFFRRSPPTPVPQTTTNEQGEVVHVDLPVATNLFLRGASIDLYVYISEDQDFNLGEALEQREEPFWFEEEILYGDWYGGPFGDGSYIKQSQIKLSEKVMNNGSLYMHVFLVESGKSLDAEDENYAGAKAIMSRTKQLNKYKRRHFRTSKNLLTGDTDAHPDLVRLTNDSKFEVLSYWHPNLTLHFIDDQTVWTKAAVPSPFNEFIEFIPGTNYYYPILYFNDYWNLNSGYQPINHTTPVLNLTLTFAPLTLLRWQMYAAHGLRSKWHSFMGEGIGEESDDEQDSLKMAFLETNPYLLGVTIGVSVVHIVLEFLAFKNDIQFWRNCQSLEGLSVRSVFFGVFQSFVVLLYVFDNETNFIIKISVFVGLVIELWKIHKVVDITLDAENRVCGVLPRLKFQDKSTYAESDTKKYDMLAFRYLSWVLVPLVAAYSVCSLTYLEHRGWYSWVLSMLYSFLLTFGFILMTPQLFINYKLKTVAYLPWRMLTYKAVNTFIDDLFTFVIKMPMLYRIGCFRDDVVFCIYMYQRYIYRVDPKRINELGVGGESLSQQINNAVQDNTATNTESMDTQDTDANEASDKKND